MALDTAALNVAADALATKYTHLSLHTDDPGTDGSNESDADRVSAGWGSASNGAVTASSVAFTGGTGSGACTHVGLWDAATDGNFGGGFALTGDQTFNAAGEYTVTSLTVTGTAS